MIGRTVSHYNIIEDIGFAGEDAVYKAEDTRQHRTVVLKFLRRATPAPGQEYDLEQFRHEAMAASALDHPNICSIYEIEETPDLGTFISMPFYEGETLRDRIDQGPLHIQETVKIAQEIAAGLSCAHEHGIVHRNLTPSNIVILRNGLVKILDFGLYAHPRRRKLTRAASQTVAYMSPEQLRDDIADQRTDIWSLGVMTYEMLGGRRPFEHDVEAGLLYSILSEEPVSALEIRPDCPPHLADIIQRCLQKDPENRFQSFEEFIQQLKILSGSIRMDRALFTRPLKETPAAGSASTLGRIFWPAAAVLTAVAITAVVIWQGLGGDRQPAGVETHYRVAVLPLENRAGDEPGDDFVNGLSEQVASAAASLEPYHDSMWVLPYEQTAPGMGEGAADARDAYGVNRLLAGTLQRSGDHYRLTLDVLDAETLKPVESKHIDFRRESAHSLHADVYDAVADLLDVDSPPEAKPSPQTEGMASVYENYLEGIGMLRRSDTGAEIDAAIAALQQTVRDNPSFAPAWARLADACQEEYRLTGEAVWLTRAEANCKKALELDESLVSAHMTLAEVYKETDRGEQALEMYNKALTLNPRQTSASREIGDIFAAQNRLDEAEAAYRKMVDTEPDYYAGHRALGNFYHTTGRIDDAVSEYNEALRLAPDDWSTLNNLGAIHFRQEDWGAAHELYTRSFETHPECSTASSLGTLLYLEGWFNDAAYYHRFAFENCDSTDRYSYRNLANEAAALQWMPERRGEASPLFRRAADRAEHARNESPEDTGVLGDLLGYYAVLGDRSAAQAIIDATDQRASGNAELLFRIGCAWELMGERERALQYIGDAIDGGYSIHRIESEPPLKELRDDPRYSALIERTTPDSPRN